MRALEVIFCVLFVAWVAYGVVFVAPALVSHAAPAPLVTAGQAYSVVWSCLGQVGCYGEVLKVETLRADGWADVLQCQPPTQRPTPAHADIVTRCTDRWRVNLSQALAIQPYSPAPRAAE
jgi:hypothetical protein